MPGVTVEDASPPYYFQLSAVRPTLWWMLSHRHDPGGHPIMCKHLTLRIRPPQIFINKTYDVLAMLSDDCNTSEPSALYCSCFKYKIMYITPPQTPFEAPIHRDMLILCVGSLCNSSAPVYVFCYRSSLALVAAHTEGGELSSF